MLQQRNVEIKFVFGRNMLRACKLCEVILVLKKGNLPNSNHATDFAPKPGYSQVLLMRKEANNGTGQYLALLYIVSIMVQCIAATRLHFCQHLP